MSALARISAKARRSLNGRERAWTLAGSCRNGRRPLRFSQWRLLGVRPPETQKRDVLGAMAQLRVHMRPERAGPRAVKRRPKPHRLLTEPRSMARAAILAHRAQALRQYHLCQTPFRLTGAGQVMPFVISGARVRDFAAGPCYTATGENRAAQNDAGRSRESACARGRTIVTESGGTYGSFEGRTRDPRRGIFSIHA
jgi:hypothetical protein